MAPKTTWAVVTDGVRARIVRNLDDHLADAPAELIGKARLSHVRAVLSDRTPLSVRADPGGGYLAPAPGTDPVLADMRDFAGCIVGVLLLHFRSGAFRRLAIFSTPRMLSILREEMPGDLGAAVILDRGCNLVGLPETELRDEVVRTLSRIDAT